MNIRASQTVLIAAFGVVAGLILVAGLAVVVLPERSHVHRLDTDAVAARAQLASARAQAKPAAQHVSVRASDLFRLSEAMPDSDRMPEILVDLSTLAGASSVTITSIKPAAAVPLQGYKALPLIVVAQGKYAAVTMFAHRLRDAVQTAHGKLVVNGRLFDVNQVALTSTDGRTVSATLNLDAFDYVPVAPALPSSTSGSSTSTTATTSGGST